MYCTGLYWSVTVTEQRSRASNHHVISSLLCERNYISGRTNAEQRKGMGCWEQTHLQPMGGGQKAGVKEKDKEEKTPGDNRWSLQVDTVSGLELSRTFPRGSKVTAYQVPLPQVQSVLWDCPAASSNVILTASNSIFVKYVGLKQILYTAQSLL